MTAYPFAQRLITNRGLGNMTEAKHTPGPWVIDGYDHLVGPKRQDVLMRGVTTLAAGSDEDLTEARANMRLIAKAPEMSDALKDCLRMLEAVRYTAGLGKGQWERVKKAKAVLAQATGAA